MSTMTTFDYGVAAMLAHSEAMGAISQNIANMRTAGYKRADVQFASTSKVPKWITRNIGSRGYANFNGNQNTGNFTLVIGNQIGDNDGVATKASTINHVLGVRANKLDKEVMRRLGKYIRAFNAKN